jgi:hypothetical protein
MTVDWDLFIPGAEARALTCLAALDTYWKLRSGWQPAESTDAMQRWWRAIWKDWVCVA